MIQIFINDKEIETYENTGIGITYQSASLISLELRGGHFTNQFTVPLTSKNKAIFENSHVTNSDTVLPYLFNTCSIIMDGVEVLSDGTLIIQSVTDDNITLQVLGGNSDFFNVIKTLKFSDLDFTKYNHQFTTSVILPFISATTGVIYPLMNWNKSDDTIVDFDGDLLQFNQGLQVPAIYLKDLFDLISEKTGWRFLGNLFTNNVFLKRALIPNNFKKNIDEANITNFTQVGSDQTVFSTSVSLGSITGNFVRNVFSPALDTFVSDTGAFSNPIANTIICNKTGSYEVISTWKLKIVAPLGVRIGMSIRWTEGTDQGLYNSEVLWRSQNYDFFLDDKNTNRKATESSTIEIDKTISATYYFENSKYYRPFLYYIIDTSNSDISTGHEFSLLLKTGSNILIKETKSICPFDNINFTTLYDYKIDTFIKDVVKLFGVNLQSNSISKELTFDFLEDLNIETEDWSDKVNINEKIDISFKYGNYFQNNYMKFKGAVNADSVFFTVDDSTLVNSGTVLEISVPNTEVFLFPKAGPTQYTLTSAKARIIDNNNRLLQSDENISNRHGSIDLIPNIDNGSLFFIDINLVAPPINTHRLNFIGFSSTSFLFSVDLTTAVAYGQSVSMEDIKVNFYSVLINMLNKIKVVNCSLNLTVADIYNLKFSKSKKIFNKNINDNFYLAKVENFKAGKLTKCTFIKI